MNGTNDRSERLLMLFLIALVLFNRPFLLIFDTAAEISGIPILFVYLFSAWLLVIVLTACAIEFSPPGDVGQFDHDFRDQDHTRPVP